MGKRIALALILVLLLGAVALRFGFSLYLGSAGFHRKISQATSQALNADGEFMPLHFNGATVYSDGFAARGTEAAFFSKLRAEQVRAQFNWRGLLHGAWQIEELSAQRLDLQLADRQGAAQSVTPPSSGFRLDLRRAAAEESNWSWSGGGVSKSALVVTPSGSDWLIEASGGKLVQSGWPPLEIDSAKFRYTHDALFVNESTLRSGAGRVAVSGEVRFDDAADLNAEFSKLALTPLLPADWRMRLSGNFSGRARIHAPMSNASAMQVGGSLSLADGQLEALPILNQIASFTGSERFRRIAINRGSLDFTRDENSINGTRIVLESEGLLRVEGAFVIRNEQIDGNFQIGVTAASLQWLPGSRERVFVAERDGYFWTTLKLSGAVAHPSEDLSARLMAAAAGQVIDDSTKAARDAAKTLLDLLPK